MCAGSELKGELKRSDPLDTRRRGRVHRRNRREKSVPDDVSISMDRWLVVATFFLSLLVFTGVGVLSSLHKRATTHDYLLAGRGVSPWLVALSAVATMSSGFMFVGMIGFTYRDGVSSMWMLVGWTIGDFLAWRFMYRRLRETSQERDEISVLALLRPRHTLNRRILVPLAGLLTIVYLAMYAAAQLKAGSTALHSIFGMPSSAGAIIGAAIVVVYCFSGGIRASIWTDAAQSIVMMGSMFVLVVVAAWNVGGPFALISELEAIDPGLTNLIPANLRFGFVLYLLGMVFGGFGVIGQPHILVRSMCIEDAAQIKRARAYYFLWLVPFYAMAIGVGLHARVLLPELGQASDVASEQALAALSLNLLPDVLVGLMLAGLFSATMSTADSQVIACSSAVTQDIQPHWKDSYKASKMTTVAVTALALGIALFSTDGVFDLVLDAWAVLSCALGPLLVISIFNWPYSQRMGVVMVLVGVVVSNIWAASPLASEIYVNLPGMAAAFLTYIVMLGIHKVRFTREERRR